LVVQLSGCTGRWAQWVFTQLRIPARLAYLALLNFVLIIFFTYFYVGDHFQPGATVADDMKKYGGFIPGIRAGKPTAEYLATCSRASRCPVRSTSR
jgi:preprotein translocase subunit SecY